MATSIRLIPSSILKVGFFSFICNLSIIHFGLSHYKEFCLLFVSNKNVCKYDFCSFFLYHRFMALLFSFSLSLSILLSFPLVGPVNSVLRMTDRRKV